MKQNNHQNIGKRSLKMTMGLLGAALFILHSSFFISSCSPEEFEGANANGLPTMEGVDFQLSVDQETNQMVASYTPKAGTYPIWIIDGTSYSTLQEVGYTNTEAGTHTIEMHIGNRNGISQAGVKKTFTFNETKLDWSADFRRITGKEWRFDNKSPQHMGCGPAGTAGTEWWSAGVDEKKDFGMYDDRITFTAETNKGGIYSYNAGADGKTYVNYGTTKWGHEDADWDAIIGNQDATWNFEVHDWTNADGEIISGQKFVRLAANTAFPYISSDLQYEEPLFRVEQLTASKMVLIYDNYTTANPPIAWRYVFTSAAEEKSFEGFDPNSDFNMWKGITPMVTFHFQPGWAEVRTAEMEASFKGGDNDYTVTVPDACNDRWQAQMHFHTDLATSSASHYDFSCLLTADKDIEGVTIKLTDEKDGQGMIEVADVSLKAGEEFIFWKSDVEGFDMNQVKLVFDFGHATGVTNINISSIVLKDHANDDGTVPPTDNPDTPDNPDSPESSIDWVAVDSPDNLGAGFNTAGTMTFWWADAGWSQVADPQFSFADGVYTIKAISATVQEWQAQCAITGVPLIIEEGQAYDVRVKIVTNMELGRVTMKVNKDPDVTNDPNTLCYKGDFNLEDGENYLEMIDVVAKNGDNLISFDQGKFILDFGGCPEGFEAKVSDIIIQKHKTEVVLNYNDEANLWKAVDEGSAFISVTPWFATGGWSQIGDPEWKHEGNKWSLTIPEGMGGDQWQGQFPINTTLTAAQTDAYNFSCTILADNDCPGVTIKLTETDEADGTKHDGNFYFADRHDVKADEPFVYKATDVKLSQNDAHALSLFFDFGGTPIGTNIVISDIIFEKAQ